MKSLKIGMILLIVSFSFILLAFALDLLIGISGGCGGLNYPVLVIVPILFVVAGAFFISSLFSKGNKLLKTLLMLSSFIVAFLIFAYVSMVEPNICVPEKCTFLETFSCSDPYFTQDAATFRLVNNVGSEITIVGIIVQGSPYSGYNNSVPYCTSPRESYGLPQDGEVLVKLSCNPPFVESNRKAKATISVTYVLAEDGPIHHATGEVLARVQRH